MIRVLYRWRVSPDRHAAFEQWWHAGTLRIRSTQSGSLGSTLCRSPDDPGVFVGIARWASRGDVEAFWARAVGAGFDGAELESVELLDELDQLTLETG